jgi:hypothetical protein
VNRLKRSDDGGYDQDVDEERGKYGDDKIHGQLLPEGRRRSAGIPPLSRLSHKFHAAVAGALHGANLPSGFKAENKFTSGREDRPGVAAAIAVPPAVLK